MERPIFIFGSPRSGVSLLENILGIHPELAWLSQYNNLLPTRPAVSALSQLYQFPILGALLYQIAWDRKLLGKSILPIPYESWNFWEANLPSFKRGVQATLNHPPNAENISDEEVVIIRKTLSSCTRFQGKDRLFATYGDHPRIQYLSKVFPDALFIHIVRDGRAVCESYFRMNEQGYFQSWNERYLWFKHMPESWYESFRGKHYNLFAFGVYRWKYYLTLCREESRLLPTERFIQIHYEDVVQHPIATIRQIESFADLNSSQRVRDFVTKRPPINYNTKWVKALTKNQLRQFFEIVTERENLSLLNDNV